MFKCKAITVAFIIFATSRLYCWTSPDTGKKYGMEDIDILTDSITYNSTDHLFDISCYIAISSTDTLKINPGETLKFYSTGLVIYGTIKAIGTSDNYITIGDPEHTLTELGERVDGVIFKQTSQFGESIMKYCIFNGVQLSPGFGSVICEDSSPIIDHCSFQNVPMHPVETGGVMALICRGQSYPIVSNCQFSNYIRGIAVYCGTFLNGQDKVNYPSPLMTNCNIYNSVTSFYYSPIAYDVVVYLGGFLDNCFLQSGSGGDLSLGTPEDTSGDGICTTISTNTVPKFRLVDGVRNPSSVPVTGTNEENEILPTTSKSLILKKNYPNPFNPETAIEYSIIKNGTTANLFIYDCKGNLVKKIFKDKYHIAGNFTAEWDGKDESMREVAGGVYFLKLFSGSEIIVKQAVLVK